ncbi:Uncharacterised protein [Mycobacteroides abscessus subsp. massiliense]|uniref:hypothetical protein n=1 Tax=Mycobacteroides abscessus TaxID=36809 RepID=UPI0009A71532|nr:hypothetical protein [Mycobacteroides abscessus]SKG32643.1 Uncharacterised protein [Mycobacteroides abscessus subsp. massiliense]SKH69213.1 Uncharacterised protein [Mycobacteroides abscessus subsp. massiliense]SKJ12876.1 Uncharacterised protein [Mycobacteroides abscessus subsp. massiliense]SKK57446.1 Uncharacterised protein [Mycobacteroides abscessus subsp. massiliense]SKL62663.1 Uncharacterised protein [Mycobacteroides abscessus subsp. massiliense]
MELVKALAPPVAALIALIAVFVNLHNARQQVRANAANLEKQLQAQAIEAAANRRAQLQYLQRSERREALTRAAELVHRLQLWLDKFDGTDGMTKFETPEDKRRHQAGMTSQLYNVSDDQFFISTALELVSLYELAWSLRSYDKQIRAYVLNQERTRDARDKITETALDLLKRFAESL